MRMMYWRVKLWIRINREKLYMWFIWRLPRSLMYWAVIRVWAHGTSHPWGTTAPNDLTWSEALNRWEREHE